MKYTAGKCAVESCSSQPLHFTFGLGVCDPHQQLVTEMANTRVFLALQLLSFLEQQQHANVEVINLGGVTICFVSDNNKRMNDGKARDQDCATAIRKAINAYAGDRTR